MKLLCYLIEFMSFLLPHISVNSFDPLLKLAALVIISILGHRYDTGKIHQDNGVIDWHLHTWCIGLYLSHSSFTCITDKRYVNWTLQVASAHGQKATLPFIKSVEVNSYVESVPACFIILCPHFVFARLLMLDSLLISLIMGEVNNKIKNIDIGLGVFYRTHECICTQHSCVTPVFKKVLMLNLTIF